MWKLISNTAGKVAGFFTKKGAVAAAEEAAAKGAAKAAEYAAKATAQNVFIDKVIVGGASSGIKAALKKTAIIGGTGAVVGSGVMYHQQQKANDPSSSGFMQNFTEPLRSLSFGTGSLIVGGILAAIGGIVGGLPVALLLGIVGALGGQSLVNNIPTALPSGLTPSDKPTSPTQPTPQANTPKTPEPEVKPPPGLPPTKLPASPAR